MRFEQNYPEKGATAWNQTLRERRRQPAPGRKYLTADKKNPSKMAGVWYLQTSRHKACCAAKSVVIQATLTVLSCITLFMASTTSLSTQ
ncbi:hypothetical protein EKL29_17715 [Pantoea sp. YU22]|nr:hypothetical protein EKL29_17715 [Pantoea sp. YU22]